VSVVSLAELELGVQLAGSEAVRAGRLRTLRAVQSTYVALPVDEDDASAFATLVASCSSRWASAHGSGRVDRGDRACARRPRL